MKRVRIISLPRAQSGMEVSRTSNNSMNYHTMPWSNTGNPFNHSDIEVNKTLREGGDDEPNVEVEHGETIFTDKVGDGMAQLYTAKGEMHYNGGIKLNLPEDSFIFSRDRKMKIGGPILESFGKHKDTKEKFTPATLSMKYQLNDFRKVLADPNSDKLQRSTAESMIAHYNLKLSKLGLVQESIKGFPDGLPAIAMPYLEMMQIDPSQFVGNSQQGPPQMKYGGHFQVGGQKERAAADAKAEAAARAEWYRTNRAPVVDDYEYQSQPGAMGAILAGLEAPQRAMMWAATGDYQMPGEAIKRNYPQAPGWVTGVADILVDPFLVSGIAKTAIRSSVKMVSKKGVELGVELGVNASKKKGVRIADVTSTMVKDALKDIGKKATPFNKDMMQYAIKTSYAKAFNKVQQKSFVKSFAGIPKIGLSSAMTAKLEIKLERAVINSTAREAQLWAIKLAGDKIKLGASKIGKVPAAIADDVIERTKYGYEQMAKVTPNIVDALGNISGSTAASALARPIGRAVAGSHSSDNDLAKFNAAYKISRPRPGEIVYLKNDVRISEDEYFKQYETAHGASQRNNSSAENEAIRRSNETNSYQIPVTPPVTPPVTERTIPGTSDLDPNVYETDNVDPGTYETDVEPVTYDTTMYRSDVNNMTPAQLRALDKDLFIRSKSYEIINDIKQYGGSLPKAQTGLSLSELASKQERNDITAYLGDISNRSNKSDYSDAEWRAFRDKYYPGIRTNKALQRAMLEDTVHPEFGQIIKDLHSNDIGPDGKPIGFGDLKYNQHWNDARLGHRWDAFLAKSKEPKPPVVVPPIVKPPIVPPPNQEYPVYNTPPAAWWAQDKIKMAGAFGDLGRIRKYHPWQAVPDVAYGQRTFYDPTRELAASAEQVNIGTQGAATFSGPQGYAATASALQGQGAKNAADIMSRYNNMNVGVSNELNDLNTNMYNTASQQRATAATQLYDKRTILNQQFDNSRNMARQNLRQSFMDAITNRADTYSLNTINPQFALDPRSGGKIYNIQGSNRQNFNPRFGNQQQDSQSINSYYNALIADDVSPENAKWQTELRFKGSRSNSQDDNYSNWGGYRNK